MIRSWVLGNEAHENRNGVLLFILLCVKKYGGFYILQEGSDNIMNELYHHGIKGQKWGVRRYQNSDGSLTLAGKKKCNEFTDTERSIINKLSNSYSDFTKESVNISEIRSRGNINSKDAYKCAELANEIFNRTSKIEPKITNDVISAVSNSGCKMYGLEYRLKQPTSIAGKIATDAKEKNISYKEAANGIKDSIRYTSVSNSKSFVKNYNTIKADLESKGYKEIRCKNYFELYKQGKVMHKAVQSTFKDKNGNIFELQFQTPSSQAAKELKLPLYEERRKAGINEIRAKELESGMRYLANRVKDPKYIDSILSHSDIDASNCYIEKGKRFLDMHL